jgi:hypothetical protein
MKIPSPAQTSIKVGLHFQVLLLFPILDHLHFSVMLLMQHFLPPCSDLAILLCALFPFSVATPNLLTRPLSPIGGGQFLVHVKTMRTFGGAANTCGNFEPRSQARGLPISSVATLHASQTGPRRRNWSKRRVVHRVQRRVLHEALLMKVPQKCCTLFIVTL